MKNTKTKEANLIDMVIEDFNTKQIRTSLFITSPVLKKSKKTRTGKKVWEVYVIFKNEKYLVEESRNYITGRTGYKLSVSEDGWFYFFDSAYSSKERLFEAIKLMDKKTKELKK